MVATGITANGDREILGCDIGDSEDETFWRGFLRSLKARGLAGVRLVISDQHAGLVAALRRTFQRASHQRCRVHLARNLLALVPKSHQDMVAAAFRTIFAQPDPHAVSNTWDQVHDQLASMFPKVGPLMDDAKADVAVLRTRRLDHQPFVYVWLDATYVHVREHRHVVSKAVVIATGLRADGHREVLGVDVGDSENETFWREFLTGFVDREHDESWHQEFVAGLARDVAVM